MFTWRASAIVLLTAVLLLFFVPATAGSFSAVHGPVTALRANRAAQSFYSNLSSPARALTLSIKASPRVVLDHVAGLQVERVVSEPPSVIRC